MSKTLPPVQTRQSLHTAEPPAQQGETAEDSIEERAQKLAARRLQIKIELQRLALELHQLAQFKASDFLLKAALQVRA